MTTESGARIKHLAGGRWVRLELTAPAAADTDRCPCGAPSTWHGLCDACQAAEKADATRREEKRRAQARAAVRSALPEALDAAGVPLRYQRLSRATWEARYRPWSEDSILRQLGGWP